MAFISLKSIPSGQAYPVAKLTLKRDGQIQIYLNKAAAALLSNVTNVDVMHCSETDRIAIKEGDTAKISIGVSCGIVSATKITKSINPSSFDFDVRAECTMENGMLIFKVPRTSHPEGEENA